MDRLSDANENPALSAEVLERALHATDIMVVVTDPRQDDNPIVWVNDYFCAFTGYTRADVLGRNCRFLQGDDRDQPARHELRAAVDAGDAVNVLVRNYTAGGVPFENDLFVSPIRDDPSDPDGEILYFVGVQNDVTARVAAETAALASAREAHEAAENERERFGMDLHDGLGQELAGIALLAKALHDRLAARGLDLAADAGRVSELVGGALDTARATARGLSPVDEAAGGLVQALRVLCDGADAAAPGLRVRAAIEPVLFSNGHVPRHLYRIAQEALSNAVKHAEASEIVVALHEAPRAGGGRVVQLEVSDDGVGFGAGPPPAGRRGTGIDGMRYRASLVGGDLVVRGRPGGGTVVRCVVRVGPAGER